MVLRWEATIDHTSKHQTLDLKGVRTVIYWHEGAAPYRACRWSVFGKWLLQKLSLAYTGILKLTVMWTWIPLLGMLYTLIPHHSWLCNGGMVPLARYITYTHRAIIWTCDEGMHPLTMYATYYDNHYTSCLCDEGMDPHTRYANYTDTLATYVCTLYRSLSVWWGDGPTS